MKASGVGKHILLEKPMFLTADDAQEVADYCKEKGVKLGSFCFYVAFSRCTFCC